MIGVAEPHPGDVHADGIGGGRVLADRTKVHPVARLEEEEPEHDREHVEREVHHRVLVEQRLADHRDVAEDRDLDGLEAAEQQVPLPAVAELVGQADAADRQGQARQHLVGADHDRRGGEDDAGEGADQHADGEREERVAGVRPDHERGDRTEARGCPLVRGSACRRVR